MANKEISTPVSDIVRDFAYEEKSRISPAWQLAIDIGETIILTVVMFFIIRLAVQNYQVDGTSMLPTLQNNQFVLVDKLTYVFSAPQRGDVIVFIYPNNHTLNYVKRIIGLPGDHVVVAQDGKVSVNGTVINEPYVNDLDNSLYYDEHSPYLDVTLAPHQYYVLGDNRGGSSDSRDWGPVPQNDIIGKASFVYWPFSAMHFLQNEHPVFASVPSAKIGVQPLNTLTASRGDIASQALLQNGQPLLALMLAGMPPIAGVTLRRQKRGVSAEPSRPHPPTPSPLR